MRAGTAGEIAAVVKGVNETLDTVVDKLFLVRADSRLHSFPLSVTDVDMNWTFVNSPVEKLLGVRRADVIGKQCSNWNAAICKTKDCGINRLRRNELVTVFEQQGRDFRVDSSFLTNKKGEKVGHLEFVRDTSAETKANKYRADEVRPASRKPETDGLRPARSRYRRAAR